MHEDIAFEVQVEENEDIPIDEKESLTKKGIN